MEFCLEIEFPSLSIESGSKTRGSNGAEGAVDFVTITIGEEEFIIIYKRK
jgi:hypothetical protein